MMERLESVALGNQALACVKPDVLPPEEGCGDLERFEIGIEKHSVIRLAPVA